jgi:hypothetical protein
MFTAFQEAPGCATGAGTDKMQDGIRKLDDEPEHAQAKPGPPITGMKKFFIKSARHVFSCKH